VDFLVRLDQEFVAVVIDQLSPASRDFIVSRMHPSTMTPVEAKRIRNEVLHLVYGTKYF
jgi:hypothetical protein